MAAAALIWISYKLHNFPALSCARQAWPRSVQIRPPAWAVEGVASAFESSDTYIRRGVDGLIDFFLFWSNRTGSMMCIRARWWMAFGAIQ